MSAKDITVLIPTYNRAETLAMTLASMAEVVVVGYSVEFVVIDNSSTDGTRTVVESFRDRMPVSYLFAPKQGKSSALNIALTQVQLGSIVVFTDDDVLCSKDWLLRIMEVAGRWPDNSVFGGKIELVWPGEERPYWSRIKSIQPWAFGEHDLGPVEKPYEPNRFPGGAHYWVRGKAITSMAVRFNEAVGPEPRSPMGTETTFLRKLVDSGYPCVYSPHVVIRHHVHNHLLSKKAVRERAYRWGRGMPHGKLCHRRLFEKSPTLWRVIRLCSLVRHLACYVGASLWPQRVARMEKLLNRTTWIGYDVESLRCSLRTDR